MNIKRCETIPYKNFRERLRLTKEFLNKGYIPQVILENCLFIDYSIRSRRYFGKRRRKRGAA